MEKEEGDSSQGLAADPEPAERTRLQAALARYGAPLLALRENVSARKWLASQVSSDKGTQKLTEQLADHVDSPQFLERLRAAAARHHAPPGPSSDPSSSRNEKHTEEDAGNDGEGAGAPAAADAVVRDAFWTWSESEGTFKEVHPGSASGDPSDDSAAREREPTDEELLASFVVVQRDDVVAAVAEFIAHFVAAHPQALNMEPERLQKAVSTALRDLKKGRLRRALSAGHSLYRWAVWSYGALRLYENPWIVRAASMALWASLRLVVGLVF